MLTLLTAVLCLWVAGCDSKRRPSFVLIVGDTLRADYLGSYGFQGDVSPYLDALAAESVSFDNCVAPAPWTKPSIATLFTSLHPQVHGVTDHEGISPQQHADEPRSSVLPESVLTLAEALRSAGYRTGAFVGNPWLLREFGFAQGFEDYDESEARLLSDGGVILKRARHWLDEDDGRPFLLYLHLMEAHGPYEAPAADVAVLRKAQGVGPRRPLTDTEKERLPRWFSSVPPGDVGAAGSLDYWRARYAAGVRQLDRRVGGFLEWLRTTGRMDRAWVVVTSDHGESVGEHGYFEHGTNLFEDQIRVPLIIRPPGGAEKKPRQPRREDRVMGLVDLMPTILKLAGEEVPPSWQGRDLSDLVAESGSVPGPGEPGPGRVATAAKTQPHLHAVRVGRFKLIADLESGKRLLYDLTEDPAEQRNLRRRRPDVVRDLEAVLHRHQRTVAAARAHPAVKAPITEETKLELEALGYLD